MTLPPTRASTRRRHRVYWIKPGGRDIERVEMDRDEPVLSRELAQTLES